MHVDIECEFQGVAIDPPGPNGAVVQLVIFAGGTYSERDMRAIVGIEVFVTTKGTILSLLHSITDLVGGMHTGALTDYHSSTHGP